MRGHLVAALLLASFGCEGAGDSAGAVAAARATSRADARSAWMRVTPEGLEALPAALAASLPAEGASIDVPRLRHGDLTVCTSGQCAIGLSLERMSVSPRAEGTLGLSLGVRAVAEAVGVRYEQSWACAFSGRPACTVGVDTARQAPTAITASATVATEVDAHTGLTSLSVGEARVPAGLDGGDVEIAGANGCGQVWCTLANVGIARRWLADEANRALTGAIAAEAAARTCLPCDAGCPSGASRDAGVCRSSDGACVRRPVAASAEVRSHDGRRRATVAVALADEVGVRRGGLDVALRLSARPDGRHRCAPEADPPRATPLPRSVLEGGDERGVHLRVALSEAAVSRAAWALHQTGVGCVDVGPEEVPQLDAAMLAIVLPSSIRLSVLGLSAPSVAVRPLAPPEIHVEDDGTVRIEARDLRMDIEATVDGRRLRLASGTLHARGVARIGERDGALAIEIPLDSIVMDVAAVWSAPILGADEGELRDTFEALSLAAVGVVPEVIPLDRIPVPGRLVPVRTRGVTAQGARALLVDLRVEPD